MTAQQATYLAQTQLDEARIPLVSYDASNLYRSDAWNHALTAMARLKTRTKERSWGFYLASVLHAASPASLLWDKNRNSGAIIAQFC